ncbi:hypothetical protein PHMEG_00025220 [Phytophthora megakarya]|uniref:Bzip transcription factor n=1 Tax=Phytophthora megakarya TaxID=4795 RepID=A0A225VF41_9STRA|nr:hypothetical protein PHMEG_00025220 [Phytophthora megakarya]
MSSRSASKPKPHADTSSASTTGFIQLLKTRADAPNTINLTNAAVVAEDLIRRRRRSYQRKYRQKQRNYTEDLEYGVRKIHEEIVLLQKELQYVTMGFSRSQTLWSAVTNYFRLFRRGFRSPTDTDYWCVLNVLESFMSSNVNDGFMCGPKAILSKWMLFSLCFDDVNVDLHRLEVGPLKNSVVSTVITRITISDSTLHLIFPHLVNGDPGGYITSLSRKLLGQRLVVRCSVTFEWDDTSNRIIKMQSKSDLLTPILRVLGNLEDVSRVFEGAFVTPNCSWPRFLD